MIGATKTGTPQEIAASMRRIAAEIETLPPFVTITLAQRVTVEHPKEDQK